VVTKCDIFHAKNDITQGFDMAQLLIRRLDDDAKERLKSRAERNGRSLEAEAREILKEAAEQERTRRRSPGFGTRIAGRFKRIGFTKAELERFNRAVGRSRKERARFVKFEP
jgi:plasmid stability protein